MPSDEQDACNICDGDRSTAKNPIIFCDGKGCNMPVHKRCYNVKEIPEDDWYCQRCENKKRKKATNIVCCPIQTGAVKKTEVTGDYMHVVCAMWNKSIHNEIEPYSFNSSQLDLHECCFCDKSTGFCIKCDAPDCKTRFHVTCAINNGIITPAAVVPINISIKCLQHQPRETKGKASSSSNKKRGRRLRPSREISDSEEESEEESAEESEEEDDEEDDEEEDESEDEPTFKDRTSQKPLVSNDRKTLSLSKSNASAPSTSVKKEIPVKRVASPHRLFPEDQSSDDSDDDMGTSGKSKLSFSSSVSITKVSSNTTNTKPTPTPTRSDEKNSHRERLEAKRKKSGLEARPSLLEDKKPLSITPPPSSVVTPKQKLPNKAHLGSNNSNNINNNSNGISSISSNSGIRPSITPPIKKYNGPAIKDIDEIQNDIRAGAQRWNNNASSGSSVTTPLQHPQPTTPHTAATSFFEAEAMKGQSHRKSMEGWKMMNGEKEELVRLREEARRFNEFKRSVSEVFQHLNVPVQGGTPPSVDIEGYVNHLQVILRRVGPIREQDRVQIQDCVRGAMSGNNN